MADILKKGYLLKCPQKAYAFKKWNSRWFVLFANNSRGRVRLEYYDSEKGWQLEKGKRIIPLVSCVSIKPVWHKDYNHVIEIVTSDKTYFLAAGSKDEEKAWFRSLCKAVFGSANRNSIVHLMDRPDPMDLGYHSLDRSLENTDGKVPVSSYPSSPDVTERNKSSLENLSSQIDSASVSTIDVRNSASQIHLRRAVASIGSEMSSMVSYESGFDDASSLASTIPDGTSNYQVSVRNTIASQNANMSGSYMLQVTPLNLYLLDNTTHAIIAEWPLQYLKRYGRGRTKFSFEAGDKCPNGFGVFTFNTTEGDAIFHQVDNYARKISVSQTSDLRDKRISLPDGFRPLHPTNKRWHHSEGKLSKDSSLDGILSTSSFDDSESDILGLNSAHSTPNIGKPIFPSQGRANSGLFVIKDIEIDKSPKSQKRQNRSHSVSGSHLHERTESALSEEVVNNNCISSEPSQEFNRAVAILSDSCNSLLNEPNESPMTSFTKTSQISIPYTKRVEIPLGESPEEQSIMRPSTIVEVMTSPTREEDSETQAFIFDNSNQEVSEPPKLSTDSTKSEITIVKTVSATTPKLENIVQYDDTETRQEPLTEMTAASESLQNSIPLPSTFQAPITTEHLQRNKSITEKEEHTSKCEKRLRNKKSKKATARQQSFEHPPSEKPQINKPVSFSAYDYDDYDYTYDKEAKETSGRRWPWKRTLSVLKRVEHYEQITKVAEHTTKTFHLWRQRSMRKSNDKN